MLKLPVPKEFSFAENMKYLSRSSNECLSRIYNQRLYKAVSLESGATPVVEISAEGSEALRVRFLGGTAPSRKRDREEVARYVWDWFDLDTDLRPFYEMAQGDALLRGAVDSFYGLRNIGIPDLFEALAWGIIGQQINLAFAYTLKRRLVEQFGRHVDCEGERYLVFPSARDIAGLTAADLEGIRMTRKKSEYLLGAAQLIASGELTKEGLRAAGGVKVAEKRLVGIRGIGPWTANYVLMRCLRMPDAFPVDDVGLHNAVKHVLEMDRKPTPKELLTWAEGWKQWQSYATFYLWRVLY
ncbi:DNA-3-methyladenine glycosylase [uncultured Paenibacillus sp.]|uniref:DNA-3-methyladenine glycosylase family protein n=1 Tax=uncultured Paenibacillus sp. TaxID=227322 RepID=UPI0015AB52BE|nr:DNA-3-methyladenine glycosylase [uncultured Paenibacillus sp.]